MRVLVAYGSKRGGTRGIADTIGAQLDRSGADVDVEAAHRRLDPTAYDAVIVGGALYANRWHKAARKFVKRSASVLADKPVWMFSSGPLDDSAATEVIEPVKAVQTLMDKTGARGHVTFGGRLEADAKGFPASAMAKDNAGDWRDTAQIEEWADSVAAELGVIGRSN